MKLYHYGITPTNVQSGLRVVWGGAEGFYLSGTEVKVHYGATMDSLFSHRGRLVEDKARSMCIRSKLNFICKLLQNCMFVQVLLPRYYLKHSSSHVLSPYNFNKIIL